MKISSLHCGFVLFYIFWAQCFAQKIPTKLDPELIRTHTVRPEFYDIYDGQADRFTLNGVWKFKPVVNFLGKDDKGRIICKVKDPSNPKTDEGLEKQFYNPALDDSSWNDMIVPWVWNLPLPYQTHQKIPFAGVGYYRKHFFVSQKQEGKRVFITFDAVQSECTVWVNGKLMGGHKNERPSTGPWHNYDEYVFLERFTLDITEAVKFGSENLVTVRVFDNGLPIASGIWADDGGIASPVTIEFMPQVYCENILLATDTQSREIKLKLKIANKRQSACDTELFAEISTYSSKYYSAPVQQPSQTYKLGHLKLKGLSDETLNFKFRMKTPVFWSPDSPQLYLLRIKDLDGNVIGYTRFGFRTFTTHDQNFYLNGKPIYLFGCNPDAGEWNRSFRILAYNHSNYLRYVLKLFKEMNINYIRSHRGPAAIQFYNLCDEMGFLVSIDFSPDGKMLEMSKARRLEDMEDVFVEQYIGRDGEFTPGFKKTLRNFVDFAHNNPSVIAFNAGNELGKKNQVTDSVARYFNKFYDFVKAEDLQDRPFTPSTGLVVWQWDKKIKADYYDYHDYPVSRHGWADIIPENFACYCFLEKIFGKNEMNKPVINGETLFLTSDVNALDSYQNIFPGEKFSLPNYVRWVNTLQKTKNTKNFLDFVWQYWYVRNKGIRSMGSKAARRQAAGEILEDVLRVYRRDMYFLQGVVPHNVTPSRYGWYESNSGVTPEQVERGYLNAKKNPEFSALQRAFSGIYAAVDMFDRNLFSGQALATKLFVINDTFGKSAKKLSAEIAIRQNGEKISEQCFKFGKIEANQRKITKVNLSIPEKTATGEYSLQIILRENDKPIFETSTKFFILNAHDLAALKSSKTIALYDPSGMVGDILKKFDISYRAIKSFKDLDNYNVLILGPSSFDKTISYNSAAINRWVSKGGNLVCLSQNRQGAIPFYRKLKIQPAGGAVLTCDEIWPDSPLVSGMTPVNWDLWNGKREVVDGALSAENKKIFYDYIMPMTPDVVVSGAERGGQWYHNITIGMVLADVRHGKGRMIFSQALACERFGKDSSATLLLYNILKTVSQKTDTPAECHNGQLADIQHILILGNSLTKHGPSTAKLGWKYDWGMAATSLENDYVHQLYKLICQVQIPAGRKPELKVETMLAYKISISKKLLDYKADFIVVQIGDNLREPLITHKDFVVPYVKLIQELKKANKDAIIVVTSLWSPEPIRNAMVQQVAKETGAIFVDLRPLSANPQNSAKAEGNFTHTGVNWHPGNRGMHEIAQQIWKTVCQKRAG